MTGVRALIIYAVVVVLVSGGLSGGLYLLLDPFMAVWEFDSFDFGKFCFRIMQICAIIGSIPLLAAFGHRGWSAWGLGRNRLFLAHLGRGMLLGLVSLSVICVVLLAFDMRVIRPDLITDPGHWVDVVIRSAIAALVIAVIEEAWFRGALHNIAASVLSPFGAIVVIAAFYALAHFLRPDAPTLDGQSVQLWSGFTAIFSGIGSFPLVGMRDSIVALFIAGLLLGILRTRHGNIAMCVGVHVGWVFVIKVYKKFTYINHQSELNMLVGQYDGVLGWLAAGLLLLVTLLVWRSGGLRGSRSV